MKYDGPERRKEYRRSSDRDVCAYHDICGQMNKDHFKDQKDFNEKMEKEMESKLPAWVFKLFLTTVIPVAMALGGWLALQTFEMNRTMVRLDTNQVRLMRVFDVEPKPAPK